MDIQFPPAASSGMDASSNVFELERVCCWVGEAEFEGNKGLVGSTELYCENPHVP